MKRVILVIAFIAVGLSAGDKQYCNNKLKTLEKNISKWRLSAANNMGKFSMCMNTFAVQNNAIDLLTECKSTNEQTSFYTQTLSMMTKYSESMGCR